MGGKDMNGDHDDWVWPSSRHSLTQPARNDRTFADIGWQRSHGEYGRITGNRRSAEILFRSLIESPTNSDLDTVIYPYAANWRHHIELQLKEVLSALQALLGGPQVATSTHNIAKLWSEVKARLQAEWPDDTSELAHVTRIIGQFSSMDPDGQGFRYNRDQKGNFTLSRVDRIDLPTFHEGLRSVSNFLSAVDTKLDNDLEFKREMAAEYVEEYRLD